MTMLIAAEERDKSGTVDCRTSPVPVYDGSGEFAISICLMARDAFRTQTMAILSPGCSIAFVVFWGTAHELNAVSCIDF
jgi:hypothetical protein